MVPLQDLLDGGVLTNLSEYRLELLLTEKVRRASLLLHPIVDEVDEGLRNEDLADLGEDGHLVSQLTRRLLKHE